MVVVAVCVLLPEDLCDEALREQYAYWELLESVNGTTTLGEMVEFLELIRTRGGEEHMRRAQEVEKHLITEMP